MPTNHHSVTFQFVLSDLGGDVVSIKGYVQTRLVEEGLIGSHKVAFEMATDPEVETKNQEAKGELVPVDLQVGPTDKAKTSGMAGQSYDDIIAKRGPNLEGASPGKGPNMVDGLMPVEVATKELMDLVDSGQVVPTTKHANLGAGT